MKNEEDQHTPFPGRAVQARRTWFWSHLFFASLSIVAAGLIYQNTGRVVLSLIFGIVGIIELVNVWANPFKNAKK